MSDVSESQWLGLAIRSESDQPHEWLPIGWSIRNRVLSSRYPDAYQEVVLQHRQFSYFNKFKSVSFDEIYDLARKGYAGDESGWVENNLTEAEKCAAEVISAPRYHAPFGADVMHYYSPISMVPKGAKPAWLRTATRLVYPSGIDPVRFVFAAGVK